MEILDSIIEVLYKLESYWNICRPCQCKGYCCVGADISVDVNEWSIIKEYIQYLPLKEKDELKNNIAGKKQCIFHTADKCLIHNIRPENCRLTPYQALVNRDNILQYYMIRINPGTHECRYKYIEKEVIQEKRIEFEQNPYVLLPNYDTYTKYISLNWLVKNCSENLKTLHVSEWLKEDPLL